MGFFSWKTSDTHKSISNSYSCRPTFTVYLLQPHGLPPIREDEYEGYGDFGGQDVYELLALWHDLPRNRDIGIDINFSNYPVTLEYPIKLVEDGTLRYEDVEASESCPNQGFFFDDDMDEGDEGDFI
jgi:hypothetical protein